MVSLNMVREQLPTGELKLSAGDCSFTYQRPRPGVLLVTITGSDRGQFGTATLDEIRLELLRNRPLEIFVDAAGATAVRASVSREWTQFFSLNREQLKRVSVLAGSKAIELTVAIAQHLSQTGNLLQIYTDRELFDARLASSR